MATTVSDVNNMFWGFNAADLEEVKAQIASARKTMLGVLQQTGGSLVLSGSLEGSQVQLKPTPEMLQEAAAHWEAANAELNNEPIPQHNQRVVSYRG